MLSSTHAKHAIILTIYPIGGDMKRVSSFVSCIMLFLILCLFPMGCATAPTYQEIQNADYGSYPNNYQEIIKSYMENLLFDPYSAVYSNWCGPSQGYSGNNFIKIAYGYRICVEINAKNRMGGYVGKKKHYFLIHNGSIVQQFDEFGASQFCTFN